MKIISHTISLPFVLIVIQTQLFVFIIMEQGIKTYYELSFI